ncbi:hypothetical protein C8A03DRAFT_12005 [Achaetomium macrosporum]|uniref:Uncharacterized protein n=1 Tax=Achaetomium macrosporum TaxID=79813 RepID=A0AAN7H9S7_9PEZI|nr:hypothetical protein C8A03DRAFT_12005 [Achaetomium macrosporum]
MSSWPSEDWPGDSADGDQQGRPTDLTSLGIFSPRGQLVGITPEQTERALKLLSIPFDSLPQLPAFAPLFGYTTNWHKSQVAKAVVGASMDLRRVLTATEADALAYHRSRCCWKAAWSPPLALATTLYFTLRGRATLRFPFVTPDPARFNPNSFPTASRPFLTGLPAVRLWHVLRFGAYGIVCQFLVGGFVDSYAQTTYLMNVLADGRLKAIRDAMPTAKHQQRVPDADATRGMPGYERSGTIGSRPPPQRQQQQQQPQQAAPEPQGALQDDDSFLFDDASPVAPSQRQQPQQSSTGSTPSTGKGSAWDSVRRRAIEESAKERFEQFQDQMEQDRKNLDASLERLQQSLGVRGQQRTEQHTSPTSEQEKAYSREQAQKEFDAMLERERRGEGNSGGRIVNWPTMETSTSALASTTSPTPLVITSFPSVPLTTTFTRPNEGCGGIYLPDRPPLFMIDDRPSCLPSSFSTSDSSFFYSPGIACPSGYWTACYDTTGVASITTVTCCPTYGDISLSCVADPLTLSSWWETLFCTWIAPETGTVITTTDTRGKTAVGTAQVTGPGGINAYGVRMVYQSTDLLTSTSTSSSSASATTSTAASSSTAATVSSPAVSDSASSANSSSGLSTGAKAAIGVVVPLAVIGALILGLVCWRRRRQVSVSPEQDYAAAAPAGHHQLMDQPKPPAYYYGGPPQQQPHEMQGTWHLPELPSSRQAAAELPAESTESAPMYTSYYGHGK